MRLVPVDRIHRAIPGPFPFPEADRFRGIAMVRLGSVQPKALVYGYGSWVVDHAALVENPSPHD